jgi:hypothetical protein
MVQVVALLKPCPFCGGDGRLMRADILDMSVDYPMRYVGCTNCAMQGGPLGRTDDIAIQLWNTRKDSAHGG